ncbi:GntR family transcriptional regulator [Rhodococcus sp. HNM0563]|uniref:GntR family transcriptional regulator n=1 Tax=unclassified Rhodococcus (in: high G+C Gram-positive bacteria) TaxID=192944 RepID=UPI00146F8563|nr:MULTISPECIES: GntR family transcriptional regulator [unclassified Rhodococcus (in: high G+C Gram-positive bacteria)]MCK0089467.1 GntR family transcriptional regulator [Rhodococcus sp. F64268]NLU62996.1 GntR family transcriptional regulator [Rhodococcus sp. HNM0563]
MTSVTARTRSGTTVDELCTVLRDRIITGTYPPGQRMSQEQLAAEFNVSRTPLREALQRLEADGLLVATANRGMHVAPIVNSETEQNYALRILVEPPTLAAVIDDLTDDDVAEMRVALDDMQAHRAHNRRFQQAHQRFHDVALTRYPQTFADLTRSLHTMIYRHQSVYLSHQRTPEDFIHSDRHFLAAIEARNAPSARRIMEFHLIDAALGLVLDADPDHEFDSLLVALRGREIVIEHDDAGRINRPAPIYWLDHDPILPEVATSNLILRPAP